MDEEVKNIILPEEMDLYIKNLRNYRVSDIGTKFWFTNHELLVKIYQQAILEASGEREEVLKDKLILEGKLKIFLNNAYAILVWRYKILPELLKFCLSPQSTLLFYTIFFHEATLVGLLEILLFHSEACEALEETSLDLIDYCHQAIVQLFAAGDTSQDENTVNDEIEKYQRSLQFRISIRCLSILSFLVENVQRISLSAGNRLMGIHDIPCVLSEVLHRRPWLRQQHGVIEKFLDEDWRPVCGDEITLVSKTEAHTWFCLRECLLNSQMFGNYELNDFRQREISKCHGLLHDVLLDQLPPLVDLKQFLVTLNMVPMGQKQKILLLEELPQIRDKHLKQVITEGVQKIVKDHYRVLSFGDSKNLPVIAANLVNAYNLEAFDYLFDQKDTQIHFCGMCGAFALKKCSKCQTTYYCSRQCQVKHWHTHKHLCNKK